MLETPQSQFLLDVLLECTADPNSSQNNSKGGSGTLIPVERGSTGVPLVVPVMLSTVDAISHLRIHLPKDLRPLSSRETVWKAVQEIRRRWPKAVPLLDPIENMGIKDQIFRTLVQVSSLGFYLSVLTPSYRKCKSSMRPSKPI
jgi:ATP-dependent RNA helicase DOB1